MAVWLRLTAEVSSSCPWAPEGSTTVTPWLRTLLCVPLNAKPVGNHHVSGTSLSVSKQVTIQTSQEGLDPPPSLHSRELSSPSKWCSSGFLSLPTAPQHLLSCLLPERLLGFPEQAVLPKATTCGRLCPRCPPALLDSPAGPRSGPAQGPACGGGPIPWLPCPLNRDALPAACSLVGMGPASEGPRPVGREACLPRWLLSRYSPPAHVWEQEQKPGELGSRLKHSEHGMLVDTWLEGTFGSEGS